MERTVLIVDDDPIICSEISKILNRNFFRTYIANTGVDALAVLNRACDVDIILLDIFIPDMKGMEILDIIKGRWPDIEVIIMTGYSTHDLAVEALRKGAIDYLEKPIDYDDLHTAMGRALEKRTENSELIHRHSILLVDDDRELTKRLKTILEKEGYKVHIANEGEEGFQIARNNMIDVILADIEMPLLSGIDLLERVKKFQRDIEVIMMTGYGDENLAIEALRKGAINYLRKPFDLEELLITINKAVERVLLYRNQLYRNREMKINSEIVLKVNKELEKRIEERTSEITAIQGQLFQTSKLATLGEMSAGLAHELNQPLSGISLSIRAMKMMAERKMLTHQDVMETVETVDGLVKRMSNIIIHVRNFARQDIQKYTQFDVNECVMNGYNLIKEQLRIHGVECSIDLDEGLPLLLGESYQIEQVVINVITNAKDALDEKEKMAKEQVREWKKKLSIQTLIKNGWVCIDIKDNGTGMKKTTIEKYFEPFYTTKEVGKATGLGMSICYGIIQRHNGRIDVSSVYGKGAEISIKLPIAKEG